MNFGDYSPPSSPTLDQQRDALQKGLGLASQWAASGHLSDEPLLEACLQDQRFDAPTESARSDWLWQILQAIGAAECFRVPILHALYNLSDDGTVDQLCGLARHYAGTGDETFRSRLYEIVERKPFGHSPWLGEAEVIALDNEQGFLFAAGVRGRLLAIQEWDWDDGSFMDLAIERLGKERVNDLLEASSDEAIGRFRESWRQEMRRKAEKSTPQSHRERMTAIPVVEAVRAAEGESECYWLRGWGMQASETDLHSVLQCLWAARQPRVIAKLLRTFSARALPQFDARLIELCRHGNEEVRRRAFRALEPNAHPLVREFALSVLRGGLRDGSVAALFINNYRQGDEYRILEAMELPGDVCELHWLLMDAIKVLRKNPEADCSRLAVVGYALTPCANCRFNAARLLLSQHIAPEWLVEECRYDSDEDCRKLVEKPTEVSEPD